MDAHLFRRFCEALAPTLPGARLEKIYQPGEGVTVFALHGGFASSLRSPLPAGDAAGPSGDGEGPVNAEADRRFEPCAESPVSVTLRTGRRYLVLRADRKAPLLFLSTHRLSSNAHPPAPVMRLRKYLGDHRITDVQTAWTDRRLYLQVAGDAGPVWLCLDLREGPSLLFDAPVPADDPIWPDETRCPQLAAGLSPLTLCEGDGWRDWPVLTPALRRTLPFLDPADARALLADLQDGGGDVFLYQNRAGAYEVSAWPLPPAQRDRLGEDGRSREGKQDGRETVWEDPLAALALAGESQVYGSVTARARQTAALPFSAEVRRLTRLMDKLDSEETRLRALCARQADALLLQACLYRFGPEEKRASVLLEDVMAGKEAGDAAPVLREVRLDPKLTVRANMTALFHQAARGRRGLVHLERRRAVVRAERDAAVLHREAVLAGAASARIDGLPAGGSVRSKEARGSVGEAAGKAVRQADPVPSGLPRQIQAFRSSDGFLLLRGRDTRGNAMALRLAAPHDFWLHTANGPSAHVILRRDHAGQEVPERTLREAGALAALKSWLKDEERAEIQYALAKYIHPMKKAAPGMVRIDRSEGTFWAEPDAALEERLRLGSAETAER